MIWNPEYECMDRSELHALQLRRLQMSVAWVYERVPYYREQLDALGIKPRDIRTLDDLRKLPFTDKAALRDTYPFGMFAVPLDEVVRLAFVVGNDRQAGGCRLHARRHQHVD